MSKDMEDVEDTGLYKEFRRKNCRYVIVEIYNEFMQCVAIANNFKEIYGEIMRYVSMWADVKDTIIFEPIVYDEDDAWEDVPVKIVNSNCITEKYTFRVFYLEYKED